MIKTCDILRTPAAACYALLFLLATASASSPIHLDSPGQGQRVTLELDDAGAGYYSATFRTKPILEPSRLGLRIDAGSDLDGGFKILSQARSRQRGKLETRSGERAAVEYEYNELVVTLRQSRTGRLLRLVFRAFDKAIAFRYGLQKQQGVGRFTNAGELTEFHLSPEATAFSERGHEGEYVEKPISEIDERCKLPLLIRHPTAGFVHAILQADVWDYSRRFLKPTGRMSVIGVKLASQVKAADGFVTPWFLVTTAESPGALIEASYIRDALVEMRQPDPDWIVPGKVIRLVELTTRAGIEGIEFAVENGLQYVEYGAGWYGNQSDPKVDATTCIPGLDVPTVCKQGREKGVGVILYVNKIHFELQSDQIVPTYKKWGVQGLKFGFVDGRTQTGINNVHRWTQLALQHKMVVDVHDNYRPTGIQMRLPNLLTVEGIRGNEWMPTSRHNVTLPFTRYIAGAGDYTICYLNSRVKTTNAHQLALSVIHFSPLQFVYWYGRPRDYTNCMGKEWFKLVPTTWDETRVISGVIGEHFAVARRSGTDWYIGGIASETGRPLKLPLDFLDKVSSCLATIYRDGDGVELEIQRDARVQFGSVLEERLRPMGGVAIVIRK